MSNATNTPRDSTTAKAPQLRGWVEIFRAGKHKDSKGREFTASEADLDQIVANSQQLGVAPIVIGHPKEDGPAYGWNELKRDGDRLFSRAYDINPAFDDGVALGAYRNRSISVVKDATHGLRLRHVGWLGAVPPAIDGLSPMPVQFNQVDGGEVFEFASTDDALSSLGWVLGNVGQLMRALREHLIESAGAETADRVIPTWQVDQVVSGAQAVRDALADSTALFSAPTTPPNAGDPPMPHITQEQLDAAVAKARLEAQELATQQFSAQGQELAELRATRQQEVITGLINGWTAKGVVLPAEASGMAEFMAAIDGQAVFSFSAAGSEAKKAPLDWFAEFMSSRKPVVKLGSLPEDDANHVDTNSVESITTAANQFMKDQEAAGKSVTFEFAVQQVSAQLPI